MMFARMLKLDAANRLVYARVDETPDRIGDAMDYASTKPQYEKWSAEMQKASGGKSLGNVRGMHQLTAAGVVQALDFDDAGKAIDFCIKVVDDGEWKKCEEGVYTGISPGGRYLKRWNDGKYIRYTGDPQEISLVDRPMIPTATFTMIKADGVQEQRAFKAPDAMTLLADELASVGSPAEYRAVLRRQPATMIKALFSAEAMQTLAAAQGMAKADYSSDERDAMAKSGEAMDDGSFPIKSAKDVADAVDDWGRAGSKPAVKAHIAKRAKAIGATDKLPEDWDGSTKKKMAKVVSIGDMQKGMGDVAQMASLLEQLKWLACCVTQDATAERDGSALPGRLAQWLNEGVAIFTDLAAEESNEALTALQASVDAIPAQVMAKAAAGGDMLKVGAAISKSNMTHVQAIHDHARDLGADCAAGDGSMAKVAFDLATARGDNAMLKRAIETRDQRIADLEKLPAGGGPVLRGGAVERSEDGSDPAAMLKAADVPKEIADMPEGSEKSTRLFRWSMEHPTPPRAPARLG